MYNLPLPNLGAWLFILVIWEAFWKAVGLWRSARKGSLVWFIAILIINSLGIVPIIYLWYSKQLNPALEDIQTFFKSLFNKK